MKRIVRRLIGLIRQILKRNVFVSMSVELVAQNERFKDRHVLVIGGNGGIGLAIAKGFWAESADVWIAGRNPEKLGAACDVVNDKRFNSVVFDPSDVDGITQNLSRCAEMMSGIDIVINAAGAATDDERYRNEADYDFVMNINLKSLYFLTKNEAEYFVAAKRKGKIVNLTSRCYNRLYCDPYILSKWGADCVTKGFAKMFSARGVNINGVAPGPVLTDIAKRLREQKASGNYYHDHCGTNRVTTPEEVASLVMYLASGAADNITGQDIVIDGGLYN